MALSFETPRIKAFELEGGISMPERAALIQRIPKILTQPVVENLPPYFHGVKSNKLAEAWLSKMLSESRLLLLEQTDRSLIGFLFVHVENDNEAHIGYLLAEEYWGKGLGSELLQGFIKAVSKSERWLKLIGGVEPSNTASIELLKKNGFEKREGGERGVEIYEYTIPPKQS